MQMSTGFWSTVDQICPLFTLVFPLFPHSNGQSQVIVFANVPVFPYLSTNILGFNLRGSGASRPGSSPGFGTKQKQGVDFHRPAPFFVVHCRLILFPYFGLISPLILEFSSKQPILYLTKVFRRTKSTYARWLFLIEIGIKKLKIIIK